MEVRSTNASMSTEIIGQLDSPQNVEIRARVEGFVDKMLFTEGTEVKEGDTLFLLDKNRSGAAGGGQRMLAEAKAALNKYEKDVARLKPLAEKRAIPQQDLDNALASVDVGKASVRLGAGPGGIGEAGPRLLRCARADHRIDRRETGFHGRSGRARASRHCWRRSRRWIRSGSIARQRSAYLKAKAKSDGRARSVAELARVSDSGGRLGPSGQRQFVFIDRAVDVKTGTLRVRAEFPNARKLLRPGMFGANQIDLGARPGQHPGAGAGGGGIAGEELCVGRRADNKATQRTGEGGGIVDRGE